MNITIITDASCSSSERIGGYGFWIASARGKLGGGGPFREHVENPGVAEMKAVSYALYEALKAGLLQAGDRVLVRTDCLSAIAAFEGSRIVRMHHEKQILEYVEKKRKQFFLQIDYLHVKARTGETTPAALAQKYCDKRASIALRQAQLERTAYQQIEKIKEILHDW